MFSQNGKYLSSHSSAPRFDFFCVRLMVVSTISINSLPTWRRLSPELSSLIFRPYSVGFISNICHNDKQNIQCNLLIQSAFIHVKTLTRVNCTSDYAINMCMQNCQHISIQCWTEIHQDLCGITGLVRFVPDCVYNYHSHTSFSSK